MVAPADITAHAECYLDPASATVRDIEACLARRQVIKAILAPDLERADIARLVANGVRQAGFVCCEAWNPAESTGSGAEESTDGEPGVAREGRVSCAYAHYLITASHGIEPHAVAVGDRWTTCVRDRIRVHFWDPSTGALVASCDVSGNGAVAGAPAGIADAIATALRAAALPGTR